MRRKGRPSEIRWSRWLLPALVFMLLSAATLSLWHWQTRLQAEERQALANHESAAFTAEIGDRLKLHGQFLRSLHAFAISNEQENISAWRRYAQEIDVTRNLPGLVAFAYAPLIDANQRPSFSRKMHTRNSDPDYRIFPEGLAQNSLPVAFVAPDTPLHHSVLGFDMWSDPTRREAIEMAIDTRDIVLSGRTVLLFDQSNQRPGFLLIQAVYRSKPLSTHIEQRRQAFSGIVLTAYRIDEFIASLSSKRSKLFSLQIFDDGSNNRRATEQPPTLIFDSDPDLAAQPSSSVFHHELDFGKRNWILHFRLRPEALDTRLISPPKLILLGGLLAASLFALLVFNLTTHRARAERHAYEVSSQLRRSEERFRLAIAGTNDGLWDQNLLSDEDYTSPRMAEILGFRPDETSTGSAFFLARVHPEDRARRLAALRHHFRDHTPYDVEIRLQRKDGSWAWVRLRGEAVRDSNGKPVRFAGSISDISRDKEAQQNLERLRLLLSTTIAAIPLPIFVLDQQRRLLMINQAFCRLLQAEESQLLGQSWPERANCGEGDRAALQRLSECVLAGERGEAFEFRLFAHTQHPRLLVASTVHAQSQEDEALLIGTLTDVTELRAHRDHLQDLVKERTARLDLALKQAQAANLAKSEFLANMSHELRTPMHAILSFAKLGQNRSHGLHEDKLYTYFDRIGQSTQRLLGLINELLDLAKLESGKGELHRSSTELLPLLQRCINQLEPLIQGHRLNVAIDSTAPETRIEADPKRVEQVMFNLLANAIKFSPPDGHIAIQLSDAQLPSLPDDAGKKRAAVAILFTDNGIGIPAGEEESIFEKFVQSSSTKTGAGGTGLGLAICREIVSQHRGTIAAANNPSGGACITVTLPLVSPVESSS